MTMKGFPTQHKGTPEKYVTIGGAGSDRFGSHMLPVAMAKKTTLAQTIVSYNSATGELEITAHTAKAGDLIKFDSGANQYCEAPVLSVVSANVVKIDKRVLFGSISAGVDTAFVLTGVSLAADLDGNIVFSPGPLSYVRDAANETVTEDTGNTANNRGLPILPMFYKDGNMVSVNVDTVTPANNRLFPVELSSLAGPITVNAGDLSVSIVSTNDSVAIGDGATGLLANVTTNGTTSLEELHVTDDDAIALLTTIDQDTSDIAATLGTAGSPLAADGVHILGSDGTNSRFLKTDAAGELQVDVLSSALPSGASTLAEQQSQTTVLGDIRTAVQLIDNSANVDGTPIGTAGLAIGGRDGAGDFQQVSVNAAGELSVTFGSAGFATETTLSALNNKVANDYGASSGAVRTAAQVGNAGGVADFNAGSTGAQTLRVAANLLREGNALSYNSGAADANTLRSVLATRHEAAATPISVRLSTGSAFIADPVFDSIQTQTVSNGAGGVTFTAPAGARSMQIQNSAAANGAIRFTPSAATPTASSGFYLEVGQSTPLVPAGSFKAIAVTADTGDVTVSWFV